jgi:hypothetical protein
LDIHVALFLHVFKKSHHFKNWFEFYQQYVLIYNLIIVISLVPFGWMYLQIEAGNFSPLINENWIQWIGVIIWGGICLYLIYRSYNLARSRIIKIQGEETVKTKLSVYFNIQMSKFVWYELIAMLTLVGMVLFQPVVFAVLYLFILFVFSLDWPKYTKVVHHLQLNQEEQDLLESEEELL